MDLHHPFFHLSRRWRAARRSSRLALATMVSVVIAGLVPDLVPWRPASVSAHRTMSIWDRRDSASYVVSTMNLVHVRDGRRLTSLLVHRYPVARYDVYADRRVDNLFFIEPENADGTAVAGLAYQLGWTAPMSVSPSISTLHVPAAPADVFAAFRHDRKQLIGSFSSTVPP